MAGRPAYFEMGVPDARLAREFYGALFGWDFQVTRGEDAWITIDGNFNSGLHGEDDTRQIVLYFAVDDMDEAVRKVRELGGEIVTHDYEGAGEDDAWVSCRDNQGVNFGLYRPTG
jgi:predicted enzyme related to lactoylglutathione lyase